MADLMEVLIMKMVAKTYDGKEFFYSTKECYFAPDRSASKMASEMNEIKYHLADDEKWHIYDYDCLQDFFVTGRLFYYRGNLRAEIQG